MNKFTTIVIISLLTLAASVRAQQDDGQPAQKKDRQQEHASPPKAQPGTNPQVGHPVPRARGRPTTHTSATRDRSALPGDNKAPPPIVPTSSDRDHRDASARGETADAQRIGGRHTNFHAQPKPQAAPGVAFDESRRIKDSEHWEGEKYAAFRSYHPHRHDGDWYRRHYRRIVLICGGYYYWYNFYWYPAWGYDSSRSYYVYDGPIYTGNTDESPDQVIADVQSALQTLGYYDGEVDGILGALTCEAIIAYQADNGLYQTAAIDQPTLEFLRLD